MTAAQNNISDLSSLVRETDYNTKISEIEKKASDHYLDKYITTPEFNNLAAEIFTRRLAQENLVTRTELDAKLKSLNQKINWNKANYVLLENEFRKLKTFYPSYFKGKNYFGEDGTQN